LFSFNTFDILSTIYFQGLSKNQAAAIFDKKCGVWRAPRAKTTKPAKKYPLPDF
jgi:hypothetical protein